MNTSTGQTLDLQHHSILASIPAVTEICHPLLNYYKINYFNHIRQFNDKTRICLTNNGDWVQYFCKNRLYLDAPFEEDKLETYPKGYILWELLKDTSVFAQAHQLFNIDHGITVIEPSDEFTDFYHFGMPSSQKKSYEFYLSALPSLQTFILYYKEKAAKVIANADLLHFPEFDGPEPKIKVPETEPLLSKQQEQAFLNSLNIKRFPLGGKYNNQYLTSRELHIARWLVEGKSASEIAMILGISQHTTNTHVNHIKEKLGCVKLTQVAYKLAGLNISKVLEQVRD